MPSMASRRSELCARERARCAAAPSEAEAEAEAGAGAAAVEVVAEEEAAEVEVVGSMRSMRRGRKPPSMARSSGGPRRSRTPRTGPQKSRSVP